MLTNISTSLSLYQKSPSLFQNLIGCSMAHPKLPERPKPAPREAVPTKCTTSKPDRADQEAVTQWMSLRVVGRRGRVPSSTRRSPRGLVMPIRRRSMCSESPEPSPSPAWLNKDKAQCQEAMWAGYEGWVVPAHCLENGPRNRAASFAACVHKAFIQK